MRYETLSEPSDLFALASALVRNAPNDQYTVIELNVPAVPQVAQLTPIDKENIEPLYEDAQEESSLHTLSGLFQEPEVYNANLYRAYALYKSLYRAHALYKSVLVLYKCQVSSCTRYHEV
jgi:hypothetical protein